MPQNWPLVRRETEYATIHSALVEETEVCGIVLVGDPGVGKTTLARLVTQSLPSPVRWVAGTESARSIPLGVFAHLAGLAKSHDLAGVLAATRETIHAEGGSVLGVDDAHLLDQSSATLVHQLALGGSVRIVATVCSGEPVPDAITSLWKDGYLQRLQVTPFTKQECVDLIEQALSSRVEGLSSDLIWEASSGNALFVRHLIEGALEAGTLRQVRGVWQLRGPTAITSELASLLDGRIDQLPEEVVHLLRLLTFCEPLDLHTLTGMVGDAPVEEAEARGLIRLVTERQGVDVRFNHPLYGELIRRRLGVAAAGRLRGELVRALRDQPQDTPGLRIRLAELTLDSDEKSDVELLVTAAWDAIALANITLGERLARAAVSIGGGLDASEVLARSLLWQGKAVECEETLSAFNPETMNEIELVRWGTARITNLVWSMGDAECAAEVLKSMHSKVVHPRLRLVVDGVASALSLVQNRLDEAVAHAERVLADPQACAAAMEWASIGGAQALALMGRGDQIARVAGPRQRIENDKDGMLNCLTAGGEVRALTLAGDFDVAQKRCAELARIIASSGSQYLAWSMVNVFIGTVGLARGNFLDTMSLMEQTVAALPCEPTVALSYPAQLLLAQCYSALGRVELAATMITELRTRFGQGMPLLRPQLRIAESWLAAAEGNTSRATDLALDAARQAQESGQRAIEMLALHDAARFGDHSCLPRLLELTSVISGGLATALGAHATAVSNRDADALYAAARQLEQLGALMSAADAAAQAALAYTASGDRRHASEAGATANRLAAACGGLRTPALELAGSPLPLTAREREIANLVAAGLSNREIADRLTVSIRTVEGHLYNASTKLDCTDRDQLAAVIRSGQPK